MEMNIIKSTPSLQFAVGQGSVVPFLNRCTVGQETPAECHVVWSPD